MRCLVVADLHYSLPQFDWLLAAAPQFDLVIFAGDALDVGSFVDFRAQIVVVKKYLALLAAKTRVILCSGNHDLDDRNAEGEKIARWISEVRDIGIACDGDSLTIGDTLFTVCPWWDGPLVKQRLMAQLGDAASGRLPRWIWAHHAPPADSPQMVTFLGSPPKAAMLVFTHFRPWTMSSMPWLPDTPAGFSLESSGWARNPYWPSR